MSRALRLSSVARCRFDDPDGRKRISYIVIRVGLEVEGVYAVGSLGRRSDDDQSACRVGQG